MVVTGFDQLERIARHPIYGLPEDLVLVKTHKVIIHLRRRDAPWPLDVPIFVGDSYIRIGKVETISAAAYNHLSFSSWLSITSLEAR